MLKKNHTGRIENIEQINNDVYQIEFSSPTVKKILPGQYVSILCEGLTFRRPFSVADFLDDKITVLFKKKGQGTKYISHLEVGDKIEFSAPLGNGFNIENKKSLLIGAGIGVAPIFYLNKKLKENGVKTFFAGGFVSNTYVIGKLDFISTDDGSNGNKGSVCEYLESLIQSFKPEKIYSCGPKPVLKFVADTAAKYDLESEIAMEKVMACGIGVCRGCVIKVRKDGEIQNAAVCKDGPVFKGREVVW